MACTNNCIDDCTCNDPCATNPCYEGCGCLNPTTFECITKPGVHADIDVTNDMNGLQVLDAINDAFADLADQVLALNGGISPSVDTKVKVSSGDTTSGLLNDKTLNGTFVKKTITSAGGNEKLRFDIALPDLISGDTDNILTQGSDNKLKVVDSSTVLQEGANIIITGAGTISDPKIIRANNLVKIDRTCFNNTWIILTPGATGNASVSVVASDLKYRIKNDGTIEFKGTATYSVAFAANTAAGRKHTIPVGALQITCLTALEQAGISDLKSINYIEAVGEMYGYIIRKSTQNILLEFQSSFAAATTKQIIVSFDGAVSYPNL